MKKIFLCDGPLKNNLVISCDTNKKIALSINKSTQLSHIKPNSF